jgi:hypothetical protein
MRLDSHAGAFALFVLASCASGPRPISDASLSPQAYIEQQLITPKKGELNTKTSDGGMLYHAEFNAGHPNALRLPFELLKQHCEQRGGHFVPSGRVRNTAASLVTATTPADFSATLVEADRRGLFGRFRCELPEAVWTASLEPSAFTPTDTSEFWRLQVFVKTFEGSELFSGDEQPAFTPPSAAIPTGSPAPPVAADSIRMPAGSQPVVSQQSSPLNQQPLSPPAQGDKLLADPHPFGVSLGSDSPDVFASKLRVGKGKPCAAAPAPAPPDKRAGKSKKGAAASSTADPGATQGSGLELCWEPPDASEAVSMHATFADFGAEPVLAAVEIRYPATSFGWLEHMFRNEWGSSDVDNAQPGQHVWSWQHTTVALGHHGGDPKQDTVVRALSKPTLERMQLPAGNPARDQPGPMRVATPWQLQLGYEPAELAQAKLQAVGFVIAHGSCVDSGLHARPIMTRSCRLQGGRMDGLREASVEIVDPGDSRPRLAELSYTFDKRVLDETVRELRTQYGEPTPGAAGLLQWWTGPVGIAVAPAADTFSLRYFHGRLRQYANNAREKNRTGDKELQHQGL